MNVITLNLNPAYDIHCYVEDFKPFNENLAQITENEAGGKGINISRALKYNGTESTAITVICEENGQAFIQALQNDNLNFIQINQNGRIRENITIHTDTNKETRISFAGFSADNSLIDETEKIIESIIEDNTILTFTGRVPEGISKQKIKEFLKKFKSKGILIVIDSRSLTLEDIIELKPWLIKPNQEEISEYLSENISDFDSTVKAATQIHKNGIENVMISLGEKGAVLVNTDGIFTAVPPEIDAISTIGAGDSTIAGFISATIQNKCSSEKLKTAVSFGTAACLTGGTKPPTSKNVRKIFDQIKVDKF